MNKDPLPPSHPSPRIYRQPSLKVYGDAHPKELWRAIMEDGEPLHPLENQHIISASQFSQQTLQQLFRVAAKNESNPQRFSTT